MSFIGFCSNLAFILIKMSSNRYSYLDTNAMATVFSLDELILLIFSKMSFKDRLRTRLVCRKWRQLSLQNIQELIVGRVFLDNPTLSLAIHPKYQIPMSDAENHLKLFRTYLKEGGKSLQWLHLGLTYDEKNGPEDEFDETYKETGPLWREIGQLLTDNCLNLKSLCLESSLLEFYWSMKVCVKVMKHFGPQLEEIVFESDFKHKFFELFTMCNFDCLRRLSIAVDHVEEFNVIVDRFLNLTHLAISGPIDFKNLLRLHNLQSLIFEDGIDMERLNDLGKAPFAKHLHTLKFSQVLSPPDWDFLQHFPSLRSFQTDINDSQHFIKIFQMAPYLEQLSLRFADLTMKYSSDHLLGLTQLKHLQRLHLGSDYMPVTQFGLNRLDPMPCLHSLSLRAKLDSDSEVLIDQFFDSWSIVFPNVRHIAFYCGSVRCDSLIKGLEKLSELRHFEYSRSLHRFDIFYIRMFCKDKQINFGEIL